MKLNVLINEYGYSGHLSFKTVIWRWKLAESIRLLAKVFKILTVKVTFTVSDPLNLRHYLP